MKTVLLLLTLASPLALGAAADSEMACLSEVENARREAVLANFDPDDLFNLDRLLAERRENEAHCIALAECFVDRYEDPTVFTLMVDRCLRDEESPTE